MALPLVSVCSAFERQFAGAAEACPGVADASERKRHRGLQRSSRGLAPGERYSEDAQTFHAAQR